MKAFKQWVLVFATLVTSCLFDSSKDKERTIVGTWSAHEPHISLKSKYIGFICFSENGDYNIFDLSFRDTINLSKVNGMQRNRGTWSIVGGTLKILESEWGFLNDTTGIGKDWPLKMELKPNVDSIVARIFLKGDYLFLTRPDGKIDSTNRTEPHEILKAYCPN